MTLVAVTGNRVVREYQLRSSTDADMLDRLARAFASMVYETVVLVGWSAADALTAVALDQASSVVMIRLVFEPSVKLLLES